jgi:hypothetical protein
MLSFSISSIIPKMPPPVASSNAENQNHHRSHLNAQQRKEKENAQWYIPTPKTEKKKTPSQNMKKP